MFEMKYDNQGSPIKDPQLDLAAKSEQSGNQEATQVASDQSPEDIQASPTQPENSAKQNQDQSADNGSNNYQNNMRLLREKTLRMEKERNEALLKLQQYEQQQSQYSNNHQQVQEEEAINFSEEDYVEGKHLNKAVKSLQNQLRAQKDQLKAQQMQAIELATEARLKAQYSDFDAVVNADNLNLLRISHPEIAATIHSSTGDLYTKSVSAYTMIKRLGIHAEDTFQQDKELIQKNAAKPRPVVSVAPQQGDSPLSRANAFANGLTDDLKKQLYKEMMEIKKKS